MARVVARDDVGCKHPRQRKGNPMSNRAILVVDLQNEYWPSGKFPLHGIAAAAANAARIMAHGRAGGGLVVNIRHEMPDGPLFVPGSDGARINETVQPDGDEPVITKNFPNRSEEHTSELQSLMRISYAVFCLKKKKKTKTITNMIHTNKHHTP